MIHQHALIITDAKNKALRRVSGLKSAVYLFIFQLLLFLCSVPSLPGLSYAGVDIAQCLVLVLSLQAMTSSCNSKIVPIFVPWLLLTALFFAVILGVSGLWSPVDPGPLVLPPEWQILYRKHQFDDFLHEVPTSFKNIANLMLMPAGFLVGLHYAKFLSGSSLGVLIRPLFYAGLVNLGCGIWQMVAEKIERPAALLGDAQSLSQFAALCIVVLFAQSSGSPRYSFKVVFFIVMAALAFVSGTRAAMIAIPLVAVFSGFYCLKAFRILSALVVPLMLVSSFFIARQAVPADTLIEMVSKFTSPHSIKARLVLWASFYEYYSDNWVLGAHGRVLYFADGLLWYMLIPYGVFGAFFLIFFSLFIAVNQRHKFNYLLGPYVAVLGFTHFGFLAQTLGLMLFIILGFVAATRVRQWESSVIKT